MFSKKKQAYLTEKQLEIGKILIDLDFRYDTQIDERQYTKDHIVDFVQMSLEGINEIFENIINKKIEFIFLKKII